jgi:hypothetical protein
MPVICDGPRPPQEKMGSQSWKKLGGSAAASGGGLNFGELPCITSLRSELPFPQLPGAVCVQGTMPVPGSFSFAALVASDCIAFQANREGTGRGWTRPGSSDVLDPPHTFPPLTYPRSTHKTTAPPFPSSTRLLPRLDIQRSNPPNNTKIPELPSTTRHSLIERANETRHEDR